MKEAFDACEKPYSEGSEDAAVAAVDKWLGDGAGAYEGGKAILAVASEKGHLKVVKRLLENEVVVKFELKARVKELKERAEEDDLSFSTSKGFRFARKATPSGFTLARQAACRPPEGAEKSPEDWSCKSCYDMITLYTYIGEEIPDVTTLCKVIDALRTLGWVTMDDIQDHWEDVRKSLRKKEGETMEGSLVNKLSEARYTYGSWNKHFKDEDKKWFEGPRATLLQLLSLVFAIIVSLLVFVPVFVLIFHYDLVHYEEQLWSECFMYLGIFALAQIVFAFLAAPYTGWGMIKESSRDADLGVTLRGSMHMQGLVSTFLFATIMGRLQVSLRFDLTNNVTEVNSFDTPSIVHIIGTPDTDAFDYTFAEHALKQWYAVPYTCMCTLY